ncbi:MAG TPA: molybdopterin dinucleotide binding domain-containing protein, partial [Solirubrobacterales bacterium]|nr:molybdopterin dinucleotide binding domain-containing protein [Solirubrobacterales bacterium]
ADIGGRGIRWQDASPELHQLDYPLGSQVDAVRPGGAAPPGDGELALGTYRDLWAGPITELNPPLRFLTPQQRVEVSTADAERLGLKPGDRVRVSQNGSGIEAQVQIKERVPAGVVFMAEGVLDGNANALLNGGPVQVQIEKLDEVRA